MKVKKEHLEFATEHILSGQPQVWIIERLAQQIARGRLQRVGDEIRAGDVIHEAWRQIEEKRAKLRVLRGETRRPVPGI